MTISPSHELSAKEHARSLSPSDRQEVATALRRIARLCREAKGESSPFDALFDDFSDMFGGTSQ